MPETAVPGAALEVARFEWTAPDRIEIAGLWTGLRGRRFIRPTLILKGEGEPRRLLALLDHKPWAPDESGEWIAAFPWAGEPVEFESAQLHVASGIDVEVPPPQTSPGKPRRFDRPGDKDAERKPDASRARPDAAKATPPRSAAAAQKAAASPDSPAAGTQQAPAGRETSSVGEPPAGPAPADALRTDLAALRSELDSTRGDLAAAGADGERVRGELEAARADVERLRGERDGFRRERDAALEQLRRVRGEFERERQMHERALADARAHERGAATKMLAEGAQLRAGLERQREIAYRERDDAKEARDEAIAACNEALDARDDAIRERKQAEHDRKDAFAERDRAIKARQRAEDERRKAVEAREVAEGEREQAVKEREDVMRVHERGLPLHPPKPRFLPEDHPRRSPVSLWLPRASAVGLLLLIAFIVLRLVVGH